MSLVSAYSTLYPLAQTRLAGVPDRVLIPEFKRVVREFCRDTKAWIETLPRLIVTDYQQDYTLEVAYDAAIQLLRGVMVNASTQPVEFYELYQGGTLRWGSSQVLHDITDQCCRCGATAAGALAALILVSDGSVTVDIGGTEYELTDLDFTGATTFPGCATIIQNAIRTAVDSNTGFCRYEDDHFVVYCDNAEVDYLTAGTEGTDISGAVYLNGLTGTASVGPYIEVEAALLPNLTMSALPSWFMDLHAETLVAGVVARAGMMPETWRNPQAAADALVEWRRGKARAMAHINTGRRTSVIALEG